MKNNALHVLLIGGLMGLCGCASTGDHSAERFGKIIYLDGAGNWGFGISDVPAGLKDAGYKGDVEIFVWTTSFIPLTDQLNIPAAKFRARALADRIKKYRQAYPHNDINLISLSAGTGVAIWAVEDLDSSTKVNNVILLGSSLANDYNVSKALKNMTGKVYAYHSPHDSLLDAVVLVGTIDGKRGVRCIGQVGLKPRPEYGNRVVNIPWSREYMRFGWTGAHTDCTNRTFVRDILAKLVQPQGDRMGATRSGDRLARHVTPGPVTCSDLVPPTH